MTLYKHFPVLFPCTCSNHNAWYISYLLFKFMTLSNIFPVLFQITTYEILVTCFSSTWHSKTFPRSFSGTFFKLQRLIYQLLAVLVHEVIKTFSRSFSNHNVWISVAWFSSTWRNKTFSRTFSNDNIWNISYLLLKYMTL